jgi:hypothetical protein
MFDSYSPISNYQPSEPFFSILVPTRNRANLVTETIKSVLFQTFKEFELLISNNGPDLETQFIGHHFSKLDSRISYVEYNDLPMHEHWETASSKLTGKYILILPDRSLLFRNSLMTIYHHIVSHDFPSLISWRMSEYLDSSSVLLSDLKSHSSSLVTSQTLDSKQVFLDEISGGNSTWSERLPRGLNSAVSSEFIAQLRNKYGKIFRPISPDFTFATFCLLNSAKLLFIDKPLFITRAMDVSNGGLGYSGEINSTYINSLSCDYKLFKHVPCKEFLVSNTIFEDYCEIGLLCDNELVSRNFSLSSYYMYLFQELKVKALAGKLPERRLIQIHNNIIDSIVDAELKAKMLAYSRDYLSLSRLFRIKSALTGFLESSFPRLMYSLRRVAIVFRRHGQHFPSALAAASSASHLDS